MKADLEKLINPAERGDPESPLRWTSKSLRHLAQELKRMGHQTSHRMVAELLHDLGYRLFSFISQNWRGKPLISHEVIVNLIASTTTKRGLMVRAQLDTAKYPAGRKVSEQEIEDLDLRRDSFHGEWNYAIFPRKKKASAEVIL